METCVFKNFKYWNITNTVDFKIEMFLNGGRLKIFFPIILYIYLVAFGRICNYQVYWIADALSMEGFASDQWELIGKLWQVFSSWIEVQITKIENMKYLH